KGLIPELLAQTGSRMVLANTYHLALRPGEAVVAALGGLHRFMGWDGPILTDSGGYQVFSLAARSKLTETGAAFRSHIDGRLFELDFPGYAVGGVSVGESRDQVRAALETTSHLLPPDRPRYLMGVGRPQDVVEAIGTGIDLFDCVWPTRNGRNATCMTDTG